MNPDKQAEELMRQIHSLCTAYAAVCESPAYAKALIEAEYEQERAALRAAILDALGEREAEDQLREKMADLLSRTAVALRGPEPPLTRWSWHDLPERAAAAIAAIDVMHRAAVMLAEDVNEIPAPPATEKET